jgi:hypothetical protein
MPEAKTPKTSS